jgi:hypothetical protein
MSGFPFGRRLPGSAARMRRRRGPGDGISNHAPRGAWLRWHSGRRSFVFALLLALALIPSARALAQDQLLDQATGIVPSRPYVSVLPWEKIDVYSGSLVLAFTDLVLPGNAGFDLRINRVYNLKRGGGWQIGPGFVKDADVIEGDIVKPPVIVSEDGGERLTFRASEGSWIYRTLGYGEYDRNLNRLRLPDGTTYEYDCDWNAENQRLLTAMSDAFGNRITVAYDSCDAEQASRPRLANIVQDLGNGQSRTVSFSYQAERIHTMTYLDRVWTYTWENGVLTNVAPTGRRLVVVRLLGKLAPLGNNTEQRSSPVPFQWGCREPGGNRSLVG